MTPRTTNKRQRKKLNQFLSLTNKLTIIPQELLKPFQIHLLILLTLRMINIKINIKQHLSLHNRFTLPHNRFPRRKKQILFPSLKELDQILIIKTGQKLGLFLFTPYLKCAQRIHIIILIQILFNRTHNAMINFQVIQFHIIT